jgi:DNA-binding NarL/FixJ family response regulator
MSGRKAPERRVRAIAAFDGNVYFLSCEAILLRIFLVDDNATARGTIKAALQEHAEWVVVGEACNGRQALENFPAHRPGLTVMDFIMPEMNGLEAARRLTRSDPNTLILMITTDPSTELEKEAKRAGIRGMCAKDKMHSLVDAIDTLLRGETYFPQATAA